MSIIIGDFITSVALNASRANPDLASSFPGLKDKICIKIVRRIMEITERMQAKLDGQEKKVEAVLEKQSACLESGVQALSEICGPSGCQVMWLYEWLTRATTLLHTHLLTLKTDLLTLCDKVEVDLHKLGIPVSRHLAQGISYINI